MLYAQYACSIKIIREKVQLLFIVAILISWIVEKELYIYMY